MNLTKDKYIVIITSDLEYFNSSICSGLYTEFSKKNFLIQIYLTQENEEREKEYIRQIIQRRDVSGLVIFSCLNSPAFYHEILSQTAFPCVFADRVLPYLNKCNFVAVDNYGGANKIGKLLIEKEARNIVCLSMLKHNKLSTIEDRINGFIDSHIHLSNINCQREDLEYSDIKNSIERVLSKWEKQDNFPDAVFATNHLIVNGLIDLIMHNNKWKDRSKNLIISCFDNPPYFDWLKKPIISVEQPIQEIIFYLANILLKRIENPILSSNHANVILPVKIIDRTKNSC